jgi:hypothetical protein
MRLKSPHRQILRAAYRGRDRAAELLESQRRLCAGRSQPTKG